MKIAIDLLPNFRNVILTILLLPAIASCRSVPGLHIYGLRIYDYHSQEIVRTITPGKYRELVCKEVGLDKMFFTISQKGSHLVFRKRGADGSELERHELPLLNSVWHEPSWFALSPDGNRLVYWNDATCELHLRSLKKNDDKVLFSGEKRELSKLSLIAWKNTSTVVIATDPEIENYDYIDIHKISIAGKESHTRTQYYGWGASALKVSPDGRYVCGVVKVTHKPNPDWSKGPQIMIFNLDSMKEYSRVTLKREHRVTNLIWANDSKSVFWEEHQSRPSGGKDLKTICEYRLASRSMKALLGPDKDVNLGGEMNGAVLVNNQGQWKYYNYRKNSWTNVERIDGRIVGKIRGTTRWVIAD